MNKLYLLLFAMILLCWGCSDLEVETKAYPYVITKAVTDINASGVTLNAEIESYGKDQIVDYGFIWSTSSEQYTYSLSGLTDIKKFTIRITSDLQNGTRYTCRAYVKTASNTVLGSAVDFTAMGSSTPTINKISPESGFDGDLITITGNNFSNKTANNSVYVNSVQATVESSTNSSISFRLPEQKFSGSTTVYVKAGSYQSDPVSFFVDGPTISSVSALSGYSGTHLIISGSNLTHNNKATGVYLAGYNVSCSFNSTSNQLDVLIPIPYAYLLNNITGDIQVTVGMKSVTYSKQFTILTPWTQMASRCPDGWCYNNNGFVYNGKGYFLEYNTLLMYEYTPSADSWKALSGDLFPGIRRNASVFITSGNYVYMIGGYNSLTPFGDLWRYDLINHTWIQKNNLPFSSKFVTYFRLNGEIYVLTENQQLWKCDFDNEKYTRMHDFPASFLSDFGYTFVLSNTVYAVIYGSTYRYVASTDSWTYLGTNDFTDDVYSSLPDKGFVMNNTAYILQGGESLYRYDVSLNSWTHVSNYPGSGYSYHFFFEFGNKTYVVVPSSHSYPGGQLVFLYQDQ
ncbi:MAG: IPT/TIG domain-containing protein [Bacteroidota bacterium]|nr:IPT/TIG domain-containing protein [Bacteroidota bacterium]